MPVEHTPLTKKEEAATSQQVPKNESKQMKQTNKFKAPSGYLACVTRKGNELKNLMEDECTDIELLESRVKDYSDRWERVVNTSNDQKLDGEEQQKRKIWLATNHSFTVSIRVMVGKYIDELKKSTGAKPKVVVFEKAASDYTSSSKRSSTSSARVKLAEKKASLMADKLFSDTMEKLEKKEAELQINLKTMKRKADLEKRELEQDILEKELDKIDLVELGSVIKKTA